MQPDANFFHPLRPRNTLVFFSTLGLFLGIILHNPLFVMLSASLLIALIMGVWQAWGLLESIQVKRTHHPRAFQDNTVAVELDVFGRERRAPELVLVEDHFPASTTPRIRRLVEEPLEKGQLIRIQYFGGCQHRRGLYINGPVKVQAYDVYGFFPRELYIDELTHLLVYPQAVDLTVMDLLGEGTLLHVGLDTKPQTGYSEEFIGIREYRTGDSQNIIHWKSSARHGNLMVKEFQEEITTEVAFFLDLGRMGLVGVGDQTSVEYGIKCCASLAKRAIERGHQVSLFSVGDKVDYIPPGSGTAHLLTILDRLSLLRPKGDSGFAAVVGDLTKDLRRGCTTVLVLGATTVNFDKLSPVIAQLIDRQILPVVVLIDDRAFLKIFREQETSHVEALPLDEIVKRLIVMGAKVQVIRRAKSMEQALLQGLEREDSA
jgi:uncharacterized protein (DUF58 family)